MHGRLLRPVARTGDVSARGVASTRSFEQTLLQTKEYTYTLARSFRIRGEKTPVMYREWLRVVA